MNNELMIVLLVVLIMNTALALIEALVLVWVSTDRRNDPVGQMPGTVVVQNLSTYGDREIELVNVCNGQRFNKWFRGSLILGRVIASQELPNRLFLGDQQSISRNQCCIVESQNGLVIQNMSRINMTLHNGVPANSPQPLSEGDYLDIGGSRYLVANII